MQSQEVGDSLSFSELCGHLEALVQDCLKDIQRVEVFFDRLGGSLEDSCEAKKMLERNSESLQSLDLVSQTLIDVLACLQVIGEKELNDNDMLTKSSLLMRVKLGRVKKRFNTFADDPSAKELSSGELDFF